MLAPDDRAILRELLKPPPGSHLELAVATTFTLDLTAALVAPLSFAAFDLAGASDPVAVLEAVQSAADRVIVFAQLGEIRVPSTASDLMAFLEPMVYEVKAPTPGHLFHPKIWALRYGGPDGPSYRLLCGSRNLTDDVSWDAILRLDGQVESLRSRAENRPLSDLVARLPELATRELPVERAEGIAELAAELRTVSWQAPPDVTGIAFHALGLKGRRGTAPMVEELRGRRILVMSPFVDDGGVAGVVGDAEAVIVSRPEELDRLAPETLANLSCHIVSPLAGLADPDDAAIETQGSQGVLGGLHAKLYVVERARQAHLFLGSANATSAGLFDGNVELLVQLSGGPRALGIDAFIGPDAGFGRMLEPYEPVGGAVEPPEETIGRELEKLLRRVADTQLTATVVRSGEAWTENVTSSRPVQLDPGVQLTVGLLGRPGVGHPVEDATPIDAAFAGLALADITPFVVLHARYAESGLTVDRSTVVRASLINDPDGRLDEVIARQVDSPEKFLRFLALLLGLGEAPFPAGAGAGDGAASLWFAGAGPGLFELLVRSVADRPDAIVELDRLIARLEATERGREVMPAGFTELWALIREAHDRATAVLR